jgi:hypothetical protein
MNISMVTMVPGLGASHQTGWTGVVAKTYSAIWKMDAKQLLEGGKQSAFNQNGDNTKKTK